MKKHRAVLLDLNGTVVWPLKQESLDEMTLIPGSDVAITRLLALGFVCPVVTVQSRIEKGLFTEAEFRAWFADFFGNLGLAVKGPYVCPHRYDRPCPCEKPNSLLYQQAADELSLDLSQSYTAPAHPCDDRLLTRTREEKGGGEAPDPVVTTSQRCSTECQRRWGQAPRLLHMFG